MNLMNEKMRYRLKKSVVINLAEELRIETERRIEEKCSEQLFSS